MSKEKIVVQKNWQEKGVGMVLAHPDDEALFWSLVEFLC